VTACSSPDGGTGLQPSQFDLAFAAGLAVAAAERCGLAVDAGRVRYEIVQSLLKSGADETLAERAGRAFDKTRSEYSDRLASRPDYCVTEFEADPDRLLAMEEGRFEPVNGRAPRPEHP
jgi:hypothetical protein